MNANEAARLAIYVGVRYGVGVCATPLRAIDAPGCPIDGTHGYALDIHLRGNCHHTYCHEFRRSTVEHAIDELWLEIFPDIL